MKSSTGVVGRDGVAAGASAGARVSRKALTAGFTAFAVSRALTVLVLLIAHYERGPRRVWGGWDASWYLRIARHGYPSGLKWPGETKSDWAFFPLLPVLERAAHHLGIPLVWTGLVVNAVLDVVLVVLVAVLAERVAGTEASTRASALFWFFPGTAVLSQGYSEPLFLVLVCATLLALFENHWLTAGVLTALAGATRSTGIALMAAVAIGAVLALRRGWSWRPVAAVLLAPLGLLGYLAYAQVRTGHWDQWLIAEREWNQSVDASIGIPHAIWLNVFHSRIYSTTWLLTCLTGAALLAALVLLWVRRSQLPAMPVSFWAYTAAALALMLSSTLVSTKPRFVLTLVPLFVALGAMLGKRAYPYVLAASAALLPLTLYLYLTAVHVVP